LDVKLYDHCRPVDYGGLLVVPGYIEDSYERVGYELYPLVEADTPTSSPFLFFKLLNRGHGAGLD
jgi:hypothetical protein